DAMPKALPKPPKAEVATSPALSMSSYPGDGSIRTRKVAIMVAPGVDAADVAAIQERLAREGAVARLVASRIGPCPATGKKSLDADASFENEPAVLFDAVVLPSTAKAADHLGGDGRAIEFIKDQFRHCKTLLVPDASRSLVELAGLPIDEADTGMVFGKRADSEVDAFVEALSLHRHFARESDPPTI